MLSKFFVISFFIAKNGKKDFTYSFWAFLKIFLQSVTNKESFTNFEIIIITEKILITNNCYYNVSEGVQVLQSVIRGCYTV